MEKQIAAVEEFHQAYRVPAENSPKASLSIDIIELRHRLMAEENQEYLEAAKEGDLVEVADALGDMMYILAGTMISHGMQNVIDEVFDEIHRSNMSKLGQDGQPLYREDGKVMKGPNYFKPDIQSILSD
jgi:predicted HAD superfamily Cof-like phosphohydrolase